MPVQASQIKLPVDPPVVELDNWVLVGGPKGTPCLRGRCRGHPRHADGTLITTSTVRGQRAGMPMTRHTLYLLGEPDPSYTATFPGASRLTLLEQLPVV